MPLLSDGHRSEEIMNENPLYSVCTNVTFAMKTSCWPPIVLPPGPANTSRAFVIAAGSRKGKLFSLETGNWVANGGGGRVISVENLTGAAEARQRSHHNGAGGRRRCA